MASRAFSRVKLIFAWVLAVLVVLWWIVDIYFLFFSSDFQVIMVAHEGNENVYWIPLTLKDEWYNPKVWPERGKYGVFKSDKLPGGLCGIMGSRLSRGHVCVTNDSMTSHPHWFADIIGTVSEGGPRPDAVIWFEKGAYSVEYCGPCGPFTFALGRLHYLMYTLYRIRWRIDH